MHESRWHNFIEITQQTKLRVVLVVSSELSCAVRQCRHSQNAWARHVERVESSQVEFGLYPQLQNATRLLQQGITPWKAGNLIHVIYYVNTSGQIEGERGGTALPFRQTSTAQTVNTE